jgi:glutathione synthase/RimK-type ligase-like ATP-grasp enzyme
MTVLIITHQRGFEVDPVIDQFRSLGIPFVRFNQDDGDQVSSVNYLTSYPQKLFWDCDGRKVDLNHVTHAWFHQRPPYTGQPSDFIQTIQRSNMSAFFEGAFGFLCVKWLNRVSDAVRAANKIRQLDLARTLGITIPQTLVSNDPQQIRSFCARQTSIVKNLDSPWIALEGATAVSATKLVHDEMLQDDRSIMFCPLIYQSYVERKHDYRVVVLDKEIFVARCNSQEGNVHDVRMDRDTGTFFYPTRSEGLPIANLKKMMEVLGINYCAADFIEDHSGNVYFLELNVCGAWWWMDKMFNGQILDAFVKYFSSP